MFIYRTRVSLLSLIDRQICKKVTLVFQKKTHICCILFMPCIVSLSYISLSNQCTLIILHYAIKFTIKLFLHVSNPYFGIIIRDLDCELHKLQINNNGTLQKLKCVISHLFLSVALSHCY
jgi:hypothetical protein